MNIFRKYAHSLSSLRKYCETITAKQRDKKAGKPPKSNIAASSKIPNFEIQQISKSENLTELQKLAVAKIKFFQKEIEKTYGIKIRMGAEQEFYCRNAKGKITRLNFKELKEILEKIPAVERFHKEAATPLGRKTTKQYEIVFDSSRLEDPVAVAQAVSQMQAYLSEYLSSKGLSLELSSSPDDYKPSSIHISFSLQDQEANNLFSSKEEPLTKLAKHCINSSLAVQSDGLALLANSRDSFMRYKHGVKMNSSSPGAIMANFNKGTSLRLMLKTIFTTHSAGSLGVRYPTRVSSSKILARAINLHDSITPKSTRVENRLAGSESDPYMAVLQTVASIYHALQENLIPVDQVEDKEGFDGTDYDLQKINDKDFYIKKEIAPHPESDVPLGPKKTYEALAKSELMKSLLGEELHEKVQKEYEGLMEGMLKEDISWDYLEEKYRDRVRLRRAVTFGPLFAFGSYYGFIDLLKFIATLL